MSDHVYAKRAPLLRQPTRLTITGGPAMECVHCGAISVDGCGPKGPCPGRHPTPPFRLKNPQVTVLGGAEVEAAFALSDKPDTVLIMEALVELIDWAGPPNMRGRVLDGMQAELERRVAVAKAAKE